MQLPIKRAGPLDGLSPYTHRLPMTNSIANFISFASPKGGVGKSTSCIAIAGALLSQGHRVRIIDFDQTETIWRWYTTSDFAQSIPNLTVEKGPTDDIGHFISDLYQTATDYVLLDLAGALSDLVLMVAAFATLTITPAKVSEPDIIEANKMAQNLHDVGKRIGKTINHRILLNEVPSSISNDELDLIRQIDDSNLHRFQTLIHRRAAYSKSFSRGTLPHMADAPDKKALAEIEALMTEVTRFFQQPQEQKAAA
jgi:chromosome partitioning protein